MLTPNRVNLLITKGVAGRAKAQAGGDSWLCRLMAQVVRVCGVAEVREAGWRVVHRNVQVTLERLD